MDCMFEAYREKSNQSIQQRMKNQCSDITITSIAYKKGEEALKIRNNHQKYHNSKTTTKNINSPKAAAQALFAVRQQQQFCQKVYRDALATHADNVPKTIAISAPTRPSTVQISCSNCISLKIGKDEHQRCRQQLCQLRATRCRTRNNYFAKSCLRLHGMLLEARVALATPIDELSKNQLHKKRNEDKQPLADLPWYLHKIVNSVVPATMSAAVLPSLSGTLTAACHYLAQYYKTYSHSFSFYAASSIILMLCYMTTSSAAVRAESETAALEKHHIFDESSSDKEILDLLLEKKRYDKRLLPPVNGTLTVNVNVLLLSLASPDESSLKYEVEFLLNQQWNDPRLQYGNKSQYDFLNALHHHDSIWTPDTYFIMHGDFKDPIIPMHFALRIFRNGTITYAMRRHLILSCQGSLHIFPFDDPKCSFSMESISYEEAQIKYVWKNDEDTLRKSPSLTTLNAYLIKNQTTPCDQNSWRGNYSCLRVDLIFTRDRAFYFTTVFIPGIILVTSSFITFWLEWNAVPARSMIGVTTMLNFFTTSNGFRSTLPVVSNLTAMNVWDGVCMCFIYASLLEFVCVNYVGRKRPLHNVVYRPGENPVTQASNVARTPLSTGATSFAATETLKQTKEEILGGGIRWQEAHDGIIGAAVQNLRARSIKLKTFREATRFNSSTVQPATNTEQTFERPAMSKIDKPNVTFGRVIGVNEEESSEKSSYVLRHSVATSTPALIVHIESELNSSEKIDEIKNNLGKKELPSIELIKNKGMSRLPLKPLRRKPSPSNSTSSVNAADVKSIITTKSTSPVAGALVDTGEKRRDAGASSEIVACTSCGGNNSPCTHSANNGCATETCFVQMRKKEPPHPIRVAKTIDVIARITFPTAYAIFLIFFFVHYKGFS